MKHMSRSILFLLALTCLGFSCSQVNPDFQEEARNPEYLHRSVDKLTELIVHDIFSPPVASRVYVYPSIAAYEVLAQGDPAYRSLADQLNELTPLPVLDPDLEYCLPVAAVQAFLQTGKVLVHSGETMEAFQEELMGEMKEIGIPKDAWKRSIKYGDEVAAHMLEWAKNDKYAETRSYPKYSLQDEPELWVPTPPAYMDGIEPHWREIRTMVLDSAQQFKPEPPTPFNTDPDGQFMRETMEVYEALNAPDAAERVAIAKFWDCNPYVMQQTGHVMYATKKITPGGHWMAISTLVSRQDGLSMLTSSEIYARTSIALFDAFISCWDEKYRSNLVRPETVINQYVDPDWMPALQTPPFPEYTSGHSVISRAAAVTLTKLLKEDYAFLDTTEEIYGLPARSFDSFFHASDEAAVSRLYGGIHYKPAIYNGVEQGERVGRFIAEHLITRVEGITKK